MSILDIYPRLFEIDHTFDYKSACVLDELKEEYAKNVAPEIFLKRLDKTQSMVNYFTIFESYLSSHTLDSKNIESNKGNFRSLSSFIIN